ncbi:regulator of chromosome condensation 1/beta-lactamase-inhibitor protein II [Gigaspora rosea]|uniref:Regulator of chromosome condensation 1/beta-lactamase-inhibitor protein II n=1 Tax=Gigaspora rosea TaxID=44941 RepID=A0A397VWV7_9GLOM|nr:regulator of chromosome condensation 1/beta-lactamase-inhibitor protein II [Gigaspora rosea]
MSFEPSHYFFLPNQEEIYYPNLDSLNEDALVSSQDTIISESFDFSTSESPTKECGQLCSKNYDEVIQPNRIVDLDKFQIISISAGCIHAAALTVDRKVVTWGCNDHGALGRITLDEEAEKAPNYAQGIDKIIVKVLCGANITVALSVDGQLYISGTFKDQEGILGISSKKKFEQIFTKYIPASKFKISDIAVGENHVIFLTTEGFLYSFGSGDYYQLGRKVSKRHKKNGLHPEKLHINRIRFNKIFAGSCHSFAVDLNGIVYAWGLNNYGQCGIESKDSYILPTKVKQIVGGLQHTLVLQENGYVFSFCRSYYGSLGLGKISHDKKITFPTRIKNLENCHFIATGDFHSIAVDKEGNGYTWGYSDTFALGNVNGNDEYELFKLKIPSIEFGDCGSQCTILLIQPKE